MTVHILHFNNVYHIDGGVLPRFAAALKTAKAKYPTALTVFGGDAFSPSVEASIQQGWHMVPVLNELGVDIACCGNHDFDFGAEQFAQLAGKSAFGWLLSNVVDGAGQRLAGTQEYVVLQHNGTTIGLFGLAGTDWPANCQYLPAGARILDPVSTATRLASVLKDVHAVDLVVALTHMRMPEDQQVARRCPGVDLILGGHDHGYAYVPGEPAIVKSGSDFESFSIVHVRSAGRVEVERMNVSDQTAADPAMTKLVQSVLAETRTHLSECVLITRVDLEGRSMVGRTAETNLGNLIADTLRQFYQSDMAFINSGSIRCDRVLPAGELSMKDVLEILPFNNTLVVKRVKGQDLLLALENSVGDSRTDGRFLQLSGLHIAVDLSKPEGQRILSATWNSADPLDPEHAYTVAMVNFIADGFDGYDMLRGAEHAVTVEDGGITESALLLDVLCRRSESVSVVAPTRQGRITFV
ncbi:hypothetical protein RI367_002644 [Sorochytrium milnesiophthora]